MTPARFVCFAAVLATLAGPALAREAPPEPGPDADPPRREEVVDVEAELPAVPVLTVTTFKAPLPLLSTPARPRPLRQRPAVRAPPPGQPLGDEAVGGGLRTRPRRPLRGPFSAEDNAFEIDPYLTLDVAASYRRGRLNWTLHCKNVTDTEYETRGFGAASVTPGRPFTALARVELALGSR